MPHSNFADVVAFHVKYGLPHPEVPTQLSQDLFAFRYRFLMEELHELQAAFQSDDLPGMADAIVDLVYVAMGTAVLMGLPWQLVWDRVQEANMKKIRVENISDSTRSSLFDVVKPPGWTPPDIAGVLEWWRKEQESRGPSVGF